MKLNTPMKKYKLLIAEDNTLLLQTIGLYLEAQGYELCLVTDGKDAISRIKENKYDLIVTDINIPFNNGLELISYVRNDMKLTVPILVLTTMGSENIELEAFHIGANDFITKPFSPKVLNARIEKILNQFSQSNLQ